MCQRLEKRLGLGLSTSRSRSRLGLKVKRLGLGPQSLVYIPGRRHQLWGTGARAPHDFQLFNFSGHFRAA